MTEEPRSEQQRCPMTPTTKARVKELHEKYGISLGDLVEWAAKLKIAVFERLEQDERISRGHE